MLYRLAFFALLIIPVVLLTLGAAGQLYMIVLIFVALALAGLGRIFDVASGRNHPGSWVA
jgi:hypothetical protein